MSTEASQRIKFCRIATGDTTNVLVPVWALEVALVESPILREALDEPTVAALRYRRRYGDMPHVGSGYTIDHHGQEQTSRSGYRS